MVENLSLTEWKGKQMEGRQNNNNSTTLQLCKALWFFHVRHVLSRKYSCARGSGSLHRISTLHHPPHHHPHHHLMVSPFLSLTRSHTHTYMATQKHTHTHMQVHIHTHAQTHIYHMQAHTHALLRTALVTHKGVLGSSTRILSTFCSPI